jgi:hypothetical protein
MGANEGNVVPAQAGATVVLPTVVSRREQSAAAHHQFFD